MKTINKSIYSIGIILLATILFNPILSAQNRTNRQRNYEYEQRPTQKVKSKKVKQNSTKQYHQGNKHHAKYHTGGYYSSHRNYNYNRYSSHRVYRNVPQNSNVVYLNGKKYFNHNNHFYTSCNAGAGYVLVQPPKYVRHIPRHAKLIRRQGQTMYFYGGIYFVWTPYGYRIM